VGSSGDGQGQSRTADTAIFRCESDLGWSRLIWRNAVPLRAEFRWISVGLGDTRVTPKEPIADRFVGEAVLTIPGR